MSYGIKDGAVVVDMFAINGKKFPTSAALIVSRTTGKKLAIVHDADKINYCVAFDGLFGQIDDLEKYLQKHPEERTLVMFETSF